MILNSETPKAEFKTSRAANVHISAWEHFLSLRMSLQKPLDIANQFPVGNDFSLIVSGSSKAKEHSDELIKNMRGTLSSLVTDLVDCSGENVKAVKLGSDSDLDQQWKLVSNIISDLRPNWKNVLNKWHSRLHFGSDNVKAGFKVFNHTIWDQVYRACQGDLFIFL